MIAYALAGVAIVAALTKPAAKNVKAVAGSRADFKKTVLDAAKAVDMRGIPPLYALSMAALETGWGTGRVYQQTKNLFSITAGSTWRGATYKASTGFVFRVYPTHADALADFVRLISSAKRYAAAYQAAIRNDAAGFFREVQKAGYAGDDLQYAAKLGKTLEVLA